MKRWILYLLSFAAVGLQIGCQSESSLERYFVDKSGDKNYVVLDLSPSLLNIEKVKLSAEQRDALHSFEKVNILAFQLNDGNKSVFPREIKAVESILKAEKYQQLMKFGYGTEGVSVQCVGEGEHIEEFVLFANKKENGFAVVRVIGEDMNPNAILNLFSVLQQADIDMAQLKPIKDLMIQ